MRDNDFYIVESRADWMTYGHEAVKVTDLVRGETRQGVIERAVEDGRITKPGTVSPPRLSTGFKYRTFPRACQCPQTDIDRHPGLL